MSDVSLNLDTADLAERYERISADRQFRGGQEMLRELKLAPGETVLDIGCGTGMLAEYAASLVGANGSVVGLDPLPLRIEIAKKRSAANLSFKLGNAYDLGDVAAGSFDVVYMNAVFHWLPEKSAPLRAVLRALKPGGRFGLTTVSPERDRNWLNVIRQRVLAREPYSKFPEAQAVQNYRVGRDELEKLLLDSGFAIATLETRVSSRDAARGQWTIEGALEFAEASSFGNFLGHLPKELQAQAREEIKRELENLRAQRKSDNVARQNIPRAGRIVAIATKP
ncbi:MAG TPA: class I SAM-dependent methyltransferase [Candidatus Acidoferrum sp.]|nr:class I SAM-dependent methyltransferase [Candidatus Acidoferrum sp.]